MAHSNTDYTPQEDRMLWELHEIRHQLAEEQLSPRDINRRAYQIIQHYQLENLTLMRSTEDTTNTDGERYGDQQSLSVKDLQTA